MHLVEQTIGCMFHIAECRSAKPVPIPTMRRRQLPSSCAHRVSRPDHRRRLPRREDRIRRRSIFACSIQPAPEQREFRRHFRIRAANIRNPSPSRRPSSISSLRERSVDSEVRDGGADARNLHGFPCFLARHQAVNDALSLRATVTTTTTRRVQDGSTNSARAVVATATSAADVPSWRACADWQKP